MYGEKTRHAPATQAALSRVMDNMQRTSSISSGSVGPRTSIFPSTFLGSAGYHRAFISQFSVINTVTTSA